MKSVNDSNPGYLSITCSKFENIPYNSFFTTKCNDSSILITIISCDYFILSLANEYVDDATIPTQVIKYNQIFFQADQPMRLQYSHKIKLLSFIPKH
jgi:2-hydroxy-3-keto-5-methylthiopentenyl-1-phosphate phosphatase